MMGYYRARTQAPPGPFLYPGVYRRSWTAACPCHNGCRHGEGLRAPDNPPSSDGRSCSSESPDRVLEAVEAVSWLDSSVSARKASNVGGDWAMRNCAEVPSRQAIARRPTHCGFGCQTGLAYLSQDDRFENYAVFQSPLLGDFGFQNIARPSNSMNATFIFRRSGCSVSPCSGKIHTRELDGPEVQQRHGLRASTARKAADRRGWLLK